MGKESEIHRERTTAGESSRRPKAPATRGKGHETAQQTRTKSVAREGTARAKSRASRGFSRDRRWFMASGLIVVLALLAVFATWSHFGKSESRVSLSVASGAQAAKPIATLRTEDVHALAISPRDANLVYFGHHQGVMRSDDGGYHWSSLPVKGDAMALAIPPAEPDVIYMGGHEMFLRSNDGGNTWQAVANNLPDQDIHGFAVDAKDPKTLYAFVVGHGLFKSNDSGASWKSVSNSLPNSVMSLATSGDNPQILYAGSMDQGILRSADGGVTWKPANDRLGTKMVLSLATEPSLPGLVYAGTDKGLFESADEGASWSPTDFKSPAEAVTVAPGDSKRILVVDNKNNVFRSEDGGTTWNPAG